jgi:hypothetical protein
MEDERPIPANLDYGINTKDAVEVSQRAGERGLACHNDVFHFRSNVQKPIKNT